MATASHYIDGSWREGGREAFVSTNPADDSVTWTGRQAGPEEIDAAVGAARKAFPEWSERGADDRYMFLERFAQLLEQSAHDMTEALCRETGKPRWEAKTEVQAMVAKVAISREAYQERCQGRSAPMGTGEAILRFRPHGVIAVFGPFNLPGHLPNGHIVPALLAGNTVVFKPSEQTPLIGRITADLWEHAGLPPGVLNLAQGGRSTGELLARHPGIDGLFFTGSAAAGKAIHTWFGGRPEKILALEMGGNNPLIVWDVQDFQAAATLTVLSAYITSGQRCSCARRLIVKDGAPGDGFLEQLAELIRGIRVGRYTDDPEPFMGPVISTASAERLLEAQEDLRNSGGRILVEMLPQGNRLNMLTPGLVDVTEVPNRSDEELFGPLLQVIRVVDFEAALREANNTKYGLSAGLLSDDPEQYRLFLRKIRAGVVNRNREITGASSRLPFGGIGASGNHRPSGYFAVDSCAFPVASIEHSTLSVPTSLPPGIAIPARKSLKEQP